MRALEAECDSAWDRTAGVREDDRLRSSLLRFGHEDLTHPLILLPGNERDARLGDSRLLPGDAGEVGAQIVRVLQGDLGHDAGQRGDDVGAVESPAQADLDHRHVDPAGGEIGEGDGGGGFEKAGLETLDMRAQPVGPHR